MPTFEKIREHHIPTLQATVEEYLDPATGARHVHLSNKQADLAFLVGFPTLPDASDGRAHILEHLALCGSERYPVRDPFFAMMRRSTANFMNAMTYADRTAYPFASTDRNDFFNLLDVYLDATFFPRLDYLSFRQEGWRHTLEDGKLGYQGVVFNEMKGAFADPFMTLYSGITSSLLAGTTYAVVSGGDPLAIPDLTHAALKDFHACHYHPSQAVFMTAGPISAQEIQQQIAQRVLSRFTGSRERLFPQLATVAVPRAASIRVPSQAARADEFGIQTAWILGESSDAMVYYHGALLTAGLLGDASAPLRKAMESAGFGRPSRLGGMDPSARQLLFHVGMEGLTEAQTTAARTMIWHTLEQTAEMGVPLSALRAALRDIKYQQRDTSSGRMPNVLMRMLRVLPVALRGGDVVGAFDSEAVLRQLENDIATPGFFQRLVRKLLDSPARLDATVVPDAGFFATRADIEQARLAADTAGIGDAERSRIGAESAELEAEQRKPGNAQVLPRIHPSDVSAAPRPLPAVPRPENGKYVFDIASNNLSYARVQFDVSAFPAADWPWLQLYADLRRDLGVGDLDYEAADVWRNSMVPSFMADLEAVQHATGTLRPTLVFFAGGLEEETEHIAAVLRTYIQQPRFDEHARIAFLVQRMVRGRLQGLGLAGSRFASLACTAPLSPLRHFEDLTGGAGALPFLGQLERLAASDEGLVCIAARLAAIHARLDTCQATVLCAGSGTVQQLAGLIALPQTALPAAAVSPAVLAAPAESAGSALFAPSQVNHCVIAWPAPQQEHPQAAALAVAAELMSNQLLHQALRERGGAYGGTASYANNAGVFSMSSYRDPRLSATYADFHACIDQLLKGDFSTEQVEEAIICVIKGLDRPVSPFDAAVNAWRLQQRGVDLAVRQQFRSGVLGCTLADVKNAVRVWLKNGIPSRAAFAGDAAQDLAGLELVDLLALAHPPHGAVA